MKLWVWGAAIALACLAGAAQAAERMALLIGNADYAHAGRLTNPPRDVARMATTLRALGFRVTTLTDLDEDELEDALIDFQSAASGADTALVFYSGHGMEFGGRNYLIPIDAELRRPGSERSEAVSLELAREAVSGATRLSVVIVDACRNGPPGGARSRARGLAPVEADRPGQVIAFSTAPGEVAWDGEGRLSPYTRALVESLEAKPEIDVRNLFTSLGQRTSRYAGGPQRPFARFGDMSADLVSLAGAIPETPGTPSGAQFETSLRSASSPERTRPLKKPPSGTSRPQGPSSDLYNLLLFPMLPATLPPRRDDVGGLLEQAIVMVLSEKAGRWVVGSGFFVSESVVMTAGDVAPPDASRVVVTSLALGGPIEARVVASDAGGSSDRDLAILQLDRPAPFAPAPLAAAAPDGEVRAAGFVTPFFRGAPRLVSGEEPPPEPLLTKGIVKDRDRSGWLTHTAGFGKGGDGGPLMDACGRIVGMNSWSRYVTSERRAQPAELVLQFESRHTNTARFDDQPCRR